MNVPVVVDPNEDAVTAVIRELEEESGIKGIERGQCQMFNTMYDPTQDGVNKYVVSCFHIKLGSVTPKIKLEHMFDDYAWYDLNKPQPDIELTADCQRLMNIFRQVVVLENVAVG